MKGEKMKKLLLVLLVVALASFLFVGCVPVTPAEGEGEGEGEAAICPAITITGQYAGTDKTYVKASATAEVVITYTVPTEGVDIYLVTTGSGSPYLLPYYVSADGLTYTASTSLSGDCSLIMIEVVDCYGECTCVESFTVDSEEPYAKMMLTVPECSCGGCQIVLESDFTLTGVCVDDLGCCGDDCSDLASWSTKIYNEDPYDVCCTTECAEPVGTCGTAACPIDCVTDCVPGNTTLLPVSYYIVMSMLDNVGNENKYWAMITFDSDCDVSVFKWWDTPNKPVSGPSSTNVCIDWSKDSDDFTTDLTPGGLQYFIFGTCLDY